MAMDEIKGVVSTESNVKGRIGQKTSVSGSVTIGTGSTTNYNKLTNLPMINGVTLKGNKTSFDLDLLSIRSNTTEYWNSIPDLVSASNTIYVYTDYNEESGVDIPAIKIGDGSAYLIDLPFVATTNITQSDIDNWNNKVSVMLDNTNLENLVFY